MRIRMIKLAAGPGVLMKPGEVHDVKDEEGKAFLKGGYAERLAEPKPVVVKVNEDDKKDEKKDSKDGDQDPVKDEDEEVEGFPKRERATRGGGAEKR